MCFKLIYSPILDSSTDSMATNFGKRQGILRDREVWHAAVHGVTKSLT